MSVDGDKFCFYCGNILINGGNSFICGTCKRMWNKSAYKLLEEDSEIFSDFRDAENELFMWLAEELSIHSKSSEICAAIDNAFQKNKFSINFCKKL